jgi:hypothetical protein
MRKITALILIAALTGLITSPVEAKKKKKKPVAVTSTQYLNWLGNCSGSGYLSLEPVVNDESCALFFPGVVNTYDFPGSDGLPLSLNAKEPIAVDFSLRTGASVAAEFEVEITGAVNGEEVLIASGTQTVLVAGPGFIPVHYDLEPDAALDKARITALTVTVTWTGGATYSKIDFDTTTASAVIHGFK